MHDFAGHEHEHMHEAITAFDSKEQAIALVTYMLEHNKAHTEELHEICHKLEASEEKEAAFLVDDAVDHFREGDALLQAIDGSHAGKGLRKSDNVLHLSLQGSHVRFKRGVVKAPVDGI